MDSASDSCACTSGGLDSDRPSSSCLIWACGE